MPDVPGVNGVVFSIVVVNERAVELQCKADNFFCRRALLKADKGKDHEYVRDYDRDINEHGNLEPWNYVIIHGIVYNQISSNRPTYLPSAGHNDRASMYVLRVNVK